MKSHVSSLAVALAAPALAFQPPPTRTPLTRPSLPLCNTLRDMASYPDGSQAMSEFDAFDRHGAFSRSPRGGVEGRPQAMYGGRDRMYTQDGFDPYSAYGGQFGVSQSDRAPGAMLGGGANGVHNDNTLEGFAYSSRVREHGQGRVPRRTEYGGPPFHEYPGGMEGGFDPRFAGGPMMMGGMEMGGMEYEPQGGGYYPEGLGGFGGFDGGDVDHSRLGP